MRWSLPRFATSFKRWGAVFALLFFLLTPAASWACTTIVVGKDASATGNVIFARTEDYRPTAAKRFFVYPEGYYKRGQVLRDTNGFEYTFAHDSYKFTGVPDMPVNGGELYDQHGTNEHGLGVSATNTTSLGTAVNALDPLTGNGIQEAVLPTILLAECKTVDEAITLAGNMVERYGASESFLFMVTDKNEAWIFETVSGHRWVASRVPDDSYVIVANDMVTDVVVLSDDANYRGSPTLLSFPIDENFKVYDSGSNVLNIAATYGRDAINMESNSYRRWRGYNLFSPSLAIAPKTSRDLYPYATFAKPDTKISVTDIMKFQRDRYVNTQYDLTASPQVFSGAREIDGGTPRPIGVITQQETHIYEMKRNYPEEIAAQWWMATAQSEHSVYLPFYGAITDTHPFFKNEVFSEEYDPSSAFWVFQDLAFLARSNRTKYGKPIQNYWRQYELKLVSEQAAIETELLSLYSRDRNAARKMITEYTIATTQNAINKASQIRKALIEHIASRPNDTFTVPSDQIPYVDSTVTSDLTSDERTNIAYALGLAPSQVTAATLGEITTSEMGWSLAPEINGYTTLYVPGIASSVPISAGNTAKFVYSVEIKGDDYATFGSSIENVKNRFALFQTIPVSGASDDVRQLVGPGGAVRLSDAINAGIASVYGTTDGATVTITYFLYDGEGQPRYLNGVLAVPDGNADGVLTNRLWAKMQGSQQSPSGSSGGSGGCSAGAFGALLLIGLIPALGFSCARRREAKH